MTRAKSVRSLERLHHAIDAVARDDLQFRPDDSGIVSDPGTVPINHGWMNEIVSL